jgi:hypothetical protein
MFTQITGFGLDLYIKINGLPLSTYSTKRLYLHSDSLNYTL